MNREMGEPFYGTGKAPDGYKPGDYVECTHGDGKWIHVQTPGWLGTVQYRFEANHSHYLPPIWCMDNAAQDAGYADWGVASWWAEATCRNSIIAHARTLQNGCEPMREPVDPLLLTMREAYANWHRKAENFMASESYSRGDYDDRLKVVLDALHKDWDITEKAK